MDPRLARDPDSGFVMCCICGDGHYPPYEYLAVDTDGIRWDVCVGQCAVEAGLTCQPG